MVLYVLSQVFGWLATGFRAAGMLAKKPMMVKWLVSAGNLGWMVSGILTSNIPLIASNAICLVVMLIEVIRSKHASK